MNLTFRSLLLLLAVILFVLAAFVPGFVGPQELGALQPPAQFALLRRNASRRDARAKLLYGVALQRLGR
ncbi:MAG: hypothetical protein M3P42_04585, partial [Actinomycetota bacterium]|nr:hypothetical protein [Actinomycetota bacterium]